MAIKPVAPDGHSGRDLADVIIAGLQRHGVLTLPFGRKHIRAALNNLMRCVTCNCPPAKHDRHGCRICQIACGHDWNWRDQPEDWS